MGKRHRVTTIMSTAPAAPDSKAPADPARMNRRPRRARAETALGNPFSALVTTSSLKAGLAGRRGLSHAAPSIHMRVCDLPLLPPNGAKKRATGWVDRALSPRHAAQPLAGLAYGPRNTCAVDTFLTLLHHALTWEEKALLRQVGFPPLPPPPAAGAADGSPSSSDSLSSSSASSASSSTAASVASSTSNAPSASASSCSAAAAAAAATSNPAANPAAASSQALRAALQSMRHGESSHAAKRKWYQHLCSRCNDDDDDDEVEVVSANTAAACGVGGKTKSKKRARGEESPAASSAAVASRRPPPPPLLECTCRCACADCLEGLCVKCDRCSCKTPCLMGHCFGIMEQFFTHLLPSSVTNSPFHFRTHAVWSCTRHGGHGGTGGTGGQYGCGYSFRATASMAHLPLLLQAVDIAALLKAGVPPEVDVTPARTLPGVVVPFAPPSHTPAALSWRGLPLPRLPLPPSPAPPHASWAR